MWYITSDCKVLCSNIGNIKICDSVNPPKVNNSVAMASNERELSEISDRSEKNDCKCIERR